MNRVEDEIEEFISNIRCPLLQNTPDELKDFVSNKMEMIWNGNNVRVHIPCLSWNPNFGFLDMVVTKEEILNRSHDFVSCILHKYSQMIGSLPEYMYITRKRK